MNTIGLCTINNCTQCQACISVCPKQCVRMQEAKDGFSVPVINRNECIECGLCVNSCHQITRHKELLEPLNVYAAWSKDETIRSQSSSGGVFSEIAHTIIEQGGIVYGAVMDSNLKVHHTKAENMDELAPMRGSKYVQSDISGVYSSVKEQLKTGREVLFTGTPCQVAGLYAFLKKDHENLLTCDLVCHGVPSQKSFDIYCEKVGLKKEKVMEVSFRYRNGWGLQMSSQRVKNTPPRQQKWQLISPRKSYYLRAFTSGLMFDEACYSCQYARPERVSDITMADFWGIGAEVPFRHPTQKGVSLLLVNTNKAQQFVNECKNLFTEERSLSEAIKGNHNLAKCSERPRQRDTYYDDAERLMPVELMSRYLLKPTPRDYLRWLKRLLK